MDSTLTPTHTDADIDVMDDAATKGNTATTRVLVVGNGMVSFAFCDQLSRLASNGAFQITVFGEERHPAYDRVHLTDYLANSSEDDLLLADRNWYRDRHITLHTSRKVVAIDRDAKQVTTDDGQHHPYDKLVLATGSYPFVPPSPGATNRAFMCIAPLMILKPLHRKPIANR